MKRYPRLDALERIQKIHRQLEELRLFQELLRKDPKLNKRFHNKAFEISDGLQPCINALEITLEKLKI